MYYMFYNDSIFKDITTIYEVDKIYPACVYDRMIGNYFAHNTEILDPREKRLSFNSQPNLGKISLYYDNSKYDDPVFTKLDTDQLSVLFKITEYISLSINKTIETIDTELSEDESTSMYYITGSARLSMAPKIEATIHKLNDEIPVTKHVINLPPYIEFKTNFTGSEQEEFRIYLGRNYFLNNYPLSTITQVIEPCDHSYLLNPDKATSIVDMLVKSNEFTMNSLRTPVEDEDHSGLYVYKTKFIVNGGVQYLPFGILYQGAQPSVLEIRKAIREQLLSYGSADKEIWENILPDLFVIATWYIVPFWGNSTLKSTGTMYPSVGNLNTFSKLIPQVFPELDNEFIETYEEFLTCGYIELFFASIPDPLNEKLFSIREMYPTYQYHLAQDGTGYNNMDENAKAFSKVFNNCVAVSLGETTSEQVSTNTIDGKLWYTFTSGEVEFNLLSKESYQDMMNK